MMESTTTMSTSTQLPSHFLENVQEANNDNNTNDNKSYFDILPVEIHSYIMSYCDTVDLFQLSKAYPHICTVITNKHFRFIFIDSKRLRMVPWKSIESSVKEHKTSALTFQTDKINSTRTPVYDLIKKLPNIQCLKLIGSMITIPAITNVLKNLQGRSSQKLKCIHFSITDTELLNSSNHSELVKHVPEYLNINIVENEGIRLMREYIFFINLINQFSNFHKSDTIKLNISVLRRSQEMMFDLKYLLAKGYFKSIAITVETMFMSNHTFNITFVDKYFLLSNHLYIETYGTLYLSTNLYTAITNNNLWEERVLRENDIEIRILEDQSWPLEILYCMAVFSCKISDSENSNILLKRINDRIRLRINSVYCVTKIGPNICRPLGKKSYFVATTTSVFVSEERDEENSNTLIKKPRTTRIVDIPLSSNPLMKNIENSNLQTVLFINIDRFNSSLLSSKNDLTCMSSIATLKSLKVLYLNFIPITQQKEFFVNIFKNCQDLSSLIVETDILSIQGTEGLLSSLDLCKNLKNLILSKCFIRNLKILLEAATVCTTLEHLQLTKLKSFKEIKPIELSTILKLIDSCPKLTRLAVDYDGANGLTAKQYKQYEKKLYALHPNVHVRLNKKAVLFFDQGLMPMYQDDPFHI